MELNRLYIWICFFFCLGLTAAGVLVFFRKKGKRSFLSFRLLQYFLIMMYMFGFYGVWSEILFRLFFHSEATDGTLSVISDFLAIIGTPFLLMGLGVFVAWAISLLKKKRWFVLTGMGLVIGLTIAGLGYWKFGLQIHIEQVLGLLVLSALLFGICCLVFLPVQYLEKRTKYALLLLIFFSGAIHMPLIYNVLSNPLTEFVYIFFFFLINTAIGVYFVYHAKFPEKQAVKEHTLSFDEFLQQYEITPRESEVIMEIYNGKTNREIADTLFVTLQTIKDHTHRIYQKTQVKNRGQLTSLLRKFER